LKKGIVKNRYYNLIHYKYFPNFKERIPADKPLITMCMITVYILSYESM